MNAKLLPPTNSKSCVSFSMAGPPGRNEQFGEGNVPSTNQCRPQRRPPDPGTFFYKQSYSTRAPLCAYGPGARPRVPAGLGRPGPPKCLSMVRFGGKCVSNSTALIGRRACSPRIAPSFPMSVRDGSLWRKVGSGSQVKRKTGCTRRSTTERMSGSIAN